MGKRKRRATETDTTSEPTEQIRQLAVRWQGVFRLDPAPNQSNHHRETPRSQASIFGRGRNPGNREDASTKLRQGSNVSSAKATPEQRDHEVEQRGRSSANESRAIRAERSKKKRLRLERGQILEKLRIGEILDPTVKLGQRRKILHASHLWIVRLLQGQLHLERTIPFGLFDSRGQRQFQRSSLRTDVRALLHSKPRLCFLLFADENGLEREVLGTDFRPVFGGTLLGHVLYEEFRLLHEEFDGL